MVIPLKYRDPGDHYAENDALPDAVHDIELKINVILHRRPVNTTVHTEKDNAHQVAPEHPHGTKHGGQ